MVIMNNNGSARRTGILAIMLIAVIPLALMASAKSPKVFTFIFISGFVLILIYIFAPIIAGFLARGPVSFIYMPTGGSEKDKGPAYSRARSYRQKKQYRQAIDEYLRVLEEYPDDITGYCQMMEIATGDIQNMELLEKIYQMGIHNLLKDEDKRKLGRMYDEMSIALERMIDATHVYYLNDRAK